MTKQRWGFRLKGDEEFHYSESGAEEKSFVQLVGKLERAPDNLDIRAVLFQALALLKDNHLQGQVSLFEYATLLSQRLDSIHNSNLPPNLKIDLSREASADYQRIKEKIDQLVDDQDEWVVEAARAMRLPPVPRSAPIDVTPRKSKREDMREVFGLGLGIFCLAVGVVYLLDPVLAKYVAIGVGCCLLWGVWLALTEIRDE